MSQGVALPVAPRKRGRRLPRVEKVGPGTDVGSYVVEAPLGAGGFGTVFRARRGGQLYALKVLSLAEVGPSAIREVLSLSSVHHPNVVGLHGFWQWPDEQPRYLVVVMEYVRGRQLDEWTSTENPSALGVLHRVLGVARGLVAVHAARRVHCDVKEANIIVREEDGEAVLVDFGVSAGQQSSPGEGGGLPPGTPDYRSPEAWRFWREKRWAAGERYQPTPADDVYALGVVLYWMLTNAWPFSTGTPQGVEEVLTRAPVPPHERNARVPLELSQLCLRMLDKQPEARPEPGEVCQLVEELRSRQGEPWEQPLCEAFSVHNVSTDGLEEDDGTQWVKQAREAERRPRRGLRPPKHVAESPAPAQEAAAPPEVPAPAQAIAVPVAAESAPVAQPRESSPMQRAEPSSGSIPLGLRGRIAVGLGLFAAVGALAFALGIRGHAPATSPEQEFFPGQPQKSIEPRIGLEPLLPTWESGWKVAPPLNPPEAEPAVTAAPVAPGTTVPEHEASVKTPQKQPQRMKGVKKAAALLPLCTTLSCSGPTAAVRPPPVTAEPCPPGALKAMEQLGINLGDDATSGLLPMGGGQMIKPPKEGRATLKIIKPLGKLGYGTTVTGRLIVGEKRVWGHFVQATTPQGETYPVCLEWQDELTDEGEMITTFHPKAVKEFE